MAMDQWLANIYGTGSAADDIEKTAQSHLLQKLAEEQGIDLSGLSEEQIQELASETFGAESIDDGSNDPAVEQQMAKEAQAKFEEADFLGRVMAHSYTQELEKIAGARELAGKAVGAAKGAYHAVKNKAHHLGGVVKAHTAPGSSSKVRKGIEHVGRHRGAYGAGAGAAAGLAVGRKTKEASAFEKLAMEHAQALLSNAQQVAQQNPALLQAIQSQNQPQVDQGQQFRQALDSRALEILADNGYNTDEVVGLLNGGESDQGEGVQAHDPSQIQ